MADIFVATTGNDSSNTGTIDRPFASISRAIEEADPGETIQVRGGTYYPTRGIYAGPEDSGIDIVSYNDEKVILDGSSITNNSPIVNLSGNDLSLKGFELRYSPSSGINVWGADNVEIEDNIIHHVQKAGIFVGHDWESERSQNVVVKDNEAYKTALENQSRDKNSGWDPGISGFGDKMTISGNVVHDTHGEGIAVSGEYNKVDNNIAYDNYSANFYFVNSYGTQATNNFAYNTGKSEYLRNINGQWVPAANYAYANENSSKVLNDDFGKNSLSNSIGFNGWAGLYYGGFERAGGMKDTTITGNTFYGATNEVVHIDSDAHSNTTISNNIFQQYDGKLLSYGLPQQGIKFEGNFLWNGSTEIEPPSLANGNVVANPELINPGTSRREDYQPKEGSQADVWNIGASVSASSTPSNTTSNSVTPTTSNVSNNTGGNTNNSSTAGNDWLNGTTGNETLDGKEGNDTIRSFEGNDNLIGGRGNDTLKGGDGNDTLSGGTGKDIIAGDGGYDRFVFDTNKAFDFSTRWNFDVIQNFSVGKDKIVLDKTTFVGLNNAGEFAVVNDKAAAATSAAKITYDRSSGDLFYNPNGTGSDFGDGGRIVHLTGTPALTASHILVQA
jgi:Ca2+-binding RTX toxin-like protein